MPEWLVYVGKSASAAPTEVHKRLHCFQWISLISGKFVLLIRLQKILLHWFLYPTWQRVKYLWNNCFLWDFYKTETAACTHIHRSTYMHVVLNDKQRTYTLTIPLKAYLTSRTDHVFLPTALFPLCRRMTLSDADGWRSHFSSLRDSSAPTAT